MRDGSAARETVPIEHIAGRTYAMHDGTDLKADAYLPVGTGPTPVIVIFHGGAWTKGSRASYQPWGRYLASRGYAAIAVDYRLADPSRPAFPQNVFDAKAAIQWVRANCGQLRVDPARMAVMGASAGAHLAAMVVLTRNVAELRNPYPDPFTDEDAHASVAICIAGPYDLLAQWEFDVIRRPSGQVPTEAYLGGTPASVRHRYYVASPTYHASADAASGTTWLLAWGTEDEVVTPDQHSHVLSRQLRQGGALVRHAPLPGAPHYWYLDADPEDPVSPSGVFARRLLAFLRMWSGLRDDDSDTPPA